jgi:DNA-binding response OmpR family regulator
LKPFCPHCGYDLQLDTAVLIDDFSMMGPGAQLFWRHHAVPLTGSERTLMFSLMKAYPDAVSVDVLLDRLDSTGTDNTLAVFATRIRKKLKVIGAPVPFASSHGYGKRYMRWIVE